MKRKTQAEVFDSMSNYILENFDFKKCEIAMQRLNWTWGFNQVSPTVDDLKNTAIYLMESAAKGCLESKDCKADETYMSATGGLKAEAIKNKYGQLVHLNLEFILTDWSADDDTEG